MRAEYDSQADALAIHLVADPWDRGEEEPRDEEVHSRGVVSLADGRPVSIEVLYPDRGLEEPLVAAADRYNLDREALLAAAHSALAAPDRVITIDVGVRLMA